MSVSMVVDNSNSPIIKSKNYARLPQVLDIPNLIQVQLDSFKWFMEEGIKELLQEVSPIKDFTGSKMELSFNGYEFRLPVHNVAECKQRDMTYQSNLYVRAALLIKETGEIKEQEVFLGEIPLMTENGTFVISGAERVVVNQLIRSPGVYFTISTEESGRRLCNAKLIPEHGAWLEFETSGKDVIWAKIDGRRKIAVTTLLRAISGEGDAEEALVINSDRDLIDLFKDDDDNPEHQYLSSTIDKEPDSIRTKKESLIDIYKKLRPGEPPDGESARSLIVSMFFHPRRYDLGRIGRFKLNKRLEYEKYDYHVTSRALKPRDLVEIIRKIIQINNEKVQPDDIDHLGNRRVRTTGHLIQNQFRVGLIRLERTIKERMSLQSDDPTPTNLINNRPIIASMREFFGGSQLSQFMDQTNPLAELTHKRRLSAMGPGGLSRERAGFDVRDVHHSHYGKICPIETPEGPNIGLIGSLATYARIDDLGFIETPYRKVYRELANNSAKLIDRTLRQDILEKKKLIASSGAFVDEAMAKKIAALPKSTIKIVPYVSDEIEYFTADREGDECIAQANAPLNSHDEFKEERIGAIRAGKYVMEQPEKIDYMDVSPKQVFSVTTALIPFLEHDDANRALMGSNMQRQGVPLVKPEAPLIGTGMEGEVAKYSGQVTYAEEKGEVIAVDSKRIIVKSDGRRCEYPLVKFYRTNQGTCINQHPVVKRGQIVEAGQVIADGAATQNGELALGQNVLCAFMTWRGYNFEDAIIISERLVKQDKFTSIHIEKYEVEARETKLGKEEITKDIPNVGEESLRDLDESGVIRIGAEVGPGDILVGKITPKGETELTAEEKLLRAIFGEKAREVKDTSLRVPHGEGGKVIEVKEFSADKNDDLPANVIKLVRVWIAQRRKISVGDKMAGRHGNKGVISIILPEEDMPFLPDGRPVDIVLNPIGVPSRMNIGQILETHLGLAADIFGEKVINPIFDGADNMAVEDQLGKAWIVQRCRLEGVINQDRLDAEGLKKVKKWLGEHVFNADKVLDDSGKYRGEARRASLILWLELEKDTGVGTLDRNISNEKLDEIVEKVYLGKKMVPPIFGKIQLRDGKTGELFDQPVTVGVIYMMKLIHLVDDKVHARSTGPYSLITQQPLGGKAQFGGQRFGEMEVWALEAYGASHTLQELLTVKSDDVQGRAKAYEALVKGEDVLQPGVPESFKVLFMELRSLGLAVELLNEEDQSINLFEDKKRMGNINIPKALR